MKTALLVLLVALGAYVILSPGSLESARGALGLSDAGEAVPVVYEDRHHYCPNAAQRVNDVLLHGVYNRPYTPVFPPVIHVHAGPYPWRGVGSYRRTITDESHASTHRLHVSGTFPHHPLPLVP